MNEANDPTGTTVTLKVAAFQSHRRGLFMYDWYSICSRHYPHQVGCRLCESGAWRCRWKYQMGHIFFKLWPWAWKKWANRKRSPRLTK